MSLIQYDEILADQIRQYLKMSNDDLYELGINRKTLEYQLGQLNEEIDNERVQYKERCNMLHVNDLVRYINDITEYTEYQVLCLRGNLADTIAYGKGLETLRTFYKDELVKID